MYDDSYFTSEPIAQALDEADAAIMRAEDYRDIERPDPSTHNTFIQYMLNQDALNKHHRLLKLCELRRLSSLN